MDTMKKLLSVILAMVLLLGAVALLPQAQSSAETVIANGSVNTSKLNMRTGASTKYSIVVTLAKGDAVKVLDISANWLKVEVTATGKTGYVYGPYITLTADGTLGLGRTTGNVHLRQQATKNSTSLEILKTNSGLTLLGTASNGWYQVKVLASGKTGYVSNKYVSYVSKALKGSTVTPTPSGSTTPTATPSSTVLSGKVGRINGERVNLRKGPSTSYDSIAKLTKDTAVTIIAQSGKWYQVKVDSTGKEGYVFAKYVTLPAEELKFDLPATINHDNVNLRSGPSTGFTGTTRLVKDTAVTVIGTSGNWFHIKVDATGKDGWVYKDYVSFK